MPQKDKKSAVLFLSSDAIVQMPLIIYETIEYTIGQIYFLKRKRFRFLSGLEST